MRKLILFGGLILSTFLGFGQDLMNKNFEGFRVKVSELMINKDSVKSVDPDSGQVLMYDGNKWAKGTEGDPKFTADSANLIHFGDSTDFLIPLIEAHSTSVESDPIFAADTANLLHWTDTLSKLATQDDIKSMLTGSGTAGYISQFTAAKTIDTTGIYWNGRMGIGTINPNDGNLVVNSTTGGSIALVYNDADGSAVNKATLQATSTGGLNITTLSGISVNTDDITVTNKNKYRPLLAYGSNVILRYQDFVWLGSAYVASDSYGFGSYALQNNRGANSNGFGGLTLYNNTGTNSNGFGGYALRDNTGTNSNGFGYAALYNNTGANSNGFGHAALYNNTGTNSNGFGYYALYDNTGTYSNGFGNAALQLNSGTNSNGFGNSALYNNTGANSNGFGHAALYNNTGVYSNGFGGSALWYNNWANVLAFGHQSTSYFLANAATDKAFNKASIDNIAHTITFSGAHGFGATNAKVNLKYTLTAGASPTGLVTTSIYQFTITSPTVLTYSGITGTGSSDFTGILTNSVDINNSIAIGNDVNASKANTVTIGNSSITDNYFTGNLISGKIKTTQITAALTDNTPTDAEIDTATGLTPSTAGSGWQCTIKDNNGSGLLYKVESDGTDWYYIALTKAL